MKNNIGKYLFNSIVFVSGILITLGTVIFQNYTQQEQVSIFKIVFIVLSTLIFAWVLYLFYSKFGMIKWKIKNQYKDMIGIEGRIKKQIKQLKRGKKGSYLNVTDMVEILKNKKEFEHIKNFDVLLNWMENHLKNHSRINLNGLSFKLDK